MKNAAIVYWSGTGNTQAMADSIQKGAQGAGAEVTVYTASEFNPDLTDMYDSIAFGCPSMGTEVLEESEFQPMWDAVRPKLSGKRIALFGSFGWGNGEWMRSWEKECAGHGVQFACDYVICNEAPDADAVAACEGLGKALAE